MIFKIAGGLGIFLLGMKNMSEGMQAIAGNRLRRLIAAVTNHRITACGIGTLVTCLVQSSSVTTVMVIGFVSAGFMTLVQAIGVIMGANIGTTITGWILVLKIGKYGLPILGISAFFFLFSKNQRLRYTGMALMGVGMVFYGLDIMSNGFKPMRSMPEFVEWFSKFEAVTYIGMWKCVMVGCILTTIVQSSSATLGITMGLAINGMIGFETAAALVLGENIGTTITAFLASLGQSTDAKRAACSHIVFNIIGVIWITSIFHPYLNVVSWVVKNVWGIAPEAGGEQAIKQGIALVHTGFNVVNTLIFLPFVPVLAKLVTYLVRGKPAEETHRLTYLDVRILHSASMAIQESHDEVLRMGSHVMLMMTLLREIITSEKPDQEKVSKLFHREEILDNVQMEVAEFLNKLLSGDVPQEVAIRARMQMRMADEYESLSDYLAALLKLHLKKIKNGIRFTDEEMRHILELHDNVHNYLEMINHALADNNPEVLSKARSQGDAITHMMKESRDEHLHLVGTAKSNPLATLTYTDMLCSYRRLKDHGLNIAEAIAREK
ncbi:MAG: Na/Pi cotransporter family protein [Lentisphaerae bacterium]|nr:Na/Pi cotransporter family protein [Lentisphaerota bacterium]